MKTINVALIGYKFMGKAHSHAWRTVAGFFDPDAVPVLKVVCDETRARCAISPPAGGGK